MKFMHIGLKFGSYFKDMRLKLQLFFSQNAICEPRNSITPSFLSRLIKFVLHVLLYFLKVGEVGEDKQALD